MDPAQEENQTPPQANAPVPPNPQYPPQPIAPQPNAQQPVPPQPVLAGGPNPAVAPYYGVQAPAAQPKKRHWLRNVLIGIAVVIVLMIAILLTSIFNPSTASWRNKNKANFQAAGQKVTNDEATVANDIVNQDGQSLSTDCQQLKTDLAVLQAIPAYPIKGTNDRLVAAEQATANGADDCLAGVEQQDVNLINKAGQEFKTSLEGYNSVIPIING